MKNLQGISLDTVLLQWRALRESIRECLRVTPDELLGWAPRDGMRTLGQLYVHFSSPLDWWLTNSFKDGGQWIPSIERPSDDKTKLDNDIVASFERMERYLISADLTRMYEFKGEQVSGYWIILHLFEHDSHHRGQVITYLRMNGINPPQV
ncbi:MAG: hypothetical protein A2W25_02090 [candidate division Zixibacteria bacterium RBG_16_53_22]|nr:MAG: hypothetical protein A2W25_02090 [candidate division Zixibacteria bacterium RBG_16_53_22]